MIPYWLNIPVFSFLWLRGRCQCCRAAISYQYPIVELLSAVALVGIYWKFEFIRPLSSWSWSKSLIVHPLEGIRFFHVFIFTAFLIVSSAIDFEHKIIPDVLTYPMILSSPIVFWIHPELDWKSSMIGVLFGGGVILAIHWIYYLIRKMQGIGLGDAKLLAAIGGWLGYQAVFPTLLYSSIIGSIVGITIMLYRREVNMRLEIPFGPFLAIGSLLHLFVGQTLQREILGF